MKYQLENFKGSYDFRCNYHDGWVMESHLHEYSELLYCKKGICNVVINGKHIALPENHLIWLPPNYIHQYPATEAQVVCAVFSNDYIPLYFRIAGERRLKPQPIAACELTQLLDRLPSIKMESPLLIGGYLNLICAKVVEKSEFEAAGHSDSVLYQEVISYLSAHFTEDITLKSVAKEFGYNEKYLSHSLHALTGIHFSRLLSLYRVEHAKKLLQEQRHNIAWVATECGFSALNSFNRVFKEMTGMTPSQYRNRQNG